MFIIFHFTQMPKTLIEQLPMVVSVARKVQALWKWQGQLTIKFAEYILLLLDNWCRLLSDSNENQKYKNLEDHVKKATLLRL